MLNQITINFSKKPYLIHYFAEKIELEGINGLDLEPFSINY
jgi:hypothetical protein